MFENNSQPFRQNILASSHAALGAEMLCWNHMLVPACYNGDIHPEHLSIRTKAGLTDMSGINKVWLSGGEAFEFLNYSVTRNCRKVSPGSAIYTVLLNDSGHVIDDAIVFHLDEQARAQFDADWLVCLGAGSGLQYLQKQAKKKEVNIRLDEGFVCLLLQGPKSCDLLKPLLSLCESELPKRFQHRIANIAGCTVLLSRTSYSGDDGFEIFVEGNSASQIWSLLLSEEASPVGFDALNIARVEAGLLFFGRDMTGGETPTELGLDFFCECKEHSFKGKAAYLKSKQSPKIKTVGLTIDSPICLPADAQLFVDGEVRGIIRSFVKSEWLAKAIAIAHVESKYAIEGQKLVIHSDSVKIDKNVFASICSRRFFNQLI